MKASETTETGAPTAAPRFVFFDFEAEMTVGVAAVEAAEAELDFGS